MSRLLFAFALTFASSMASAIDKDPFVGLEAPGFKILTPTQCATEANIQELEESSVLDRAEQSLRSIEEQTGSEVLVNGLLNIVPKGERLRLPSAECSRSRIEAIMLGQSRNPGVQSSQAQNFFDRCGEELAQRSPSSLSALLNVLKIRYKMCEHPRMRKVILTLEDGSRVRGFLGIKPGQEKRPLVIIKCGVTCNAGDSSHRFLTMHMFDEGPFNILAINNVTGTEYVSDNNTVLVGGFEEGQQILRVMRLMQKVPFSRRISSYHFVGVSLGSQGGLFASYMNRLNQTTHRVPPISSLLTICPVVDLKASINDLFGPSIKGKIARLYFVESVIKVIRLLPIIGDLFPDQKIEPHQIPMIVAESTVNYYRSTRGLQFFSPFENVKIKTVEDLWDYNQFLNFVDQPISAPTLAWSAEDDWIVPPESNFYPLKDHIGRRPQHDLNMILTPRGNHCAFNQVYGWDIASSVYRSFVIGNSPELMARQHTRLSALEVGSVKPSLKLWEYDKHYAQAFEVKEGKPFLYVTFKILTPNAHGSHLCWMQKIYDADESCFSYRYDKYPLSVVGEPWLRTPANVTEAQELTRWANANLTLETADGQPLFNTSEPPARFRWVSYE